MYSPLKVCHIVGKYFASKNCNCTDNLEQNIKLFHENVYLPDYTHDKCQYAHTIIIIYPNTFHLSPAKLRQSEALVPPGFNRRNPRTPIKMTRDAKLHARAAIWWPFEGALCDVYCTWFRYGLVVVC